MNRKRWIRLRSDTLEEFPPVNVANENGVLAIGGDLSVERLKLAYKRGIFPWYGEGSPIMWWSPDPRFVLFPEELRVSKSMRPYFNQGKFRVTFDTNFEAVISNCATIQREGFNSTWIIDDMKEAYIDLHKEGIAHSVEVWNGENLVGGLYGIAMGKVFFGESMFAKESNASKFGFITLVRVLKDAGYVLIDCQQETEHLASLGARPIPREDFISILEKNNEENPDNPGLWTDFN